MAEIINLHEYRIQRSATRLFAPWKKRFEKDFDYFTRLQDLSDDILCALAKPGKISEAALQEIVMAFLKLGPASKFPFLSPDEQFAAARNSELFKEQVFFEIMRRLGWLENYPCFRYSLISILESLDRNSEFCIGPLPVASACLPDFSEYESLLPELRKKFLADRFDKALESFQKRSNNKGRKEQRRSPQDCRER